MEYVIGVILIALLQYLFFTMRTGFLRAKLGVEAPHCTGNDAWQRIYRVQQNTMEQLIVFIPGMLAFAHLVSIKWALLPGLLYLVGRQLYSYQYIKDPASRAPGMVLTIFSNITLVLGAVIALGLDLAG